MEFELTKEYLEDVKVAIAASNDSFIRESFEELRAQDISIILDELDNDDSKYVISLLNQELGAEIISEMDEDIRKKFLKNFSSSEIAQYINYIDSDDAVDIINELPVQTKEEVIAFVKNKEKANHIKDLLHYDEDCAGGLMAKELIKANINWTVTQCIEEIRRQTKKVEKIFSVYVVDDQDKLLGRISLKKMLLAEDDTRIENIYDSDIIMIESYRAADEVAEIMSKYDLESIPVVDVHKRLLGRITIDDVVDVITELAEKDIQLMAGISESTEDDDNVWTLSKARLPWLLIGMMGGIFGSRFIGLFEGDLQVIPAMAFFIPLITATGGNVGIQSSSVVVQTLANKSSNINSFSIAKLFKGFIVAIINGFAISSIVFVFNILIHMDFTLSLVVSIALLSVVILASFMGTITPIIIDKLGFNPALASGPFITTANDLVGLAIYFLVAHLLL